MVKRGIIALQLVLSYVFCHTAFAQAGGIGTVANNMMDPITVFYQVVQSGCLLIGGGFLFASVVKYFEHRRSPLMVPISTVVFLLIAGLVLVALPLLAYVTQAGGVQYKY